MDISKKARVWIYQSNRPFSAEEIKGIKPLLDTFIDQWEAHGSKLAAQYEIKYNRFIILKVDEQYAGASGCSIDKSVNLMKQIEATYKVDLFDRFHIAYKDQQQVVSCSRAEFEQRIADGKINEDTIVFNNLVPTVEQLETNWEVPLRNSWHATVFSNLIGA